MKNLLELNRDELIKELLHAGDAFLNELKKGRTGFSKSEDLGKVRNYLREVVHEVERRNLIRLCEGSPISCKAPADMWLAFKLQNYW